MTQRHPGAAFPSSRGRTHLFADTALWAFAPRAVEETDRETMLQISTTPFDDRAQAQVVRNVVLTDIGRIRALAVSTDIDHDLRIAQAEDEADALRQAIRSHDYEIAQPYARAAAERLSLPCPIPLSPDFGRTVASALRKLRRIEVEVLEEGEDPIQAAWSLLDRHQITVSDGELPQFLRISDAVEAAAKGQTEEMKRKLRTTGALVIAYAGDIPLERLDSIASDLMIWLSRLPKDHGKRHGRNRHDQPGKTVPKHEEIAGADRTDGAEYAKWAARSDLSDAQKRAHLAEDLTARVTQTNLERHLDRLHQILRLATKELGYRGREKLMSYPDLAKLMSTDSERRRRENPLYIRVTRPKLRLRWSGLRLKTLLTSPIYRGCHSDKRRTKAGRMIFRDSRYWVPLILMTMGTRLTEVLQLKRGDIISRDFTLCLSLCWSAEQDGKTVSSQRIVPIPEVLLQLGFVEWVKQTCKGPNDLLFQEVMEAGDDPAQIFGKRMQTVRKGLGIEHYNEDLYALRKTLSSALWKGGVTTEDRQMIIGHVSNTVIGRHYTEADMSVLKELLDRADHGIEIAYAAPHRFPIIEDCTLVAGIPAHAEVVFDENGDLGAIRVIREDDDEQILALAIREADMPARPRWKGLQVCARTTAPDALADVLREYVVLPPGNETCRRAYEHFLAMAASSSDAKVTDGAC